MSLLTTLLSQTAALADSSDATYEETTYTNALAVQVSVTLEVVTLLDVIVVDGAPASVTFAVRASKETDGAWTGDRIRFYVDHVTEPGLSATVSIATSHGTPGDIDSGAQVTSADGTPWNWAHLAETTVAVSADVTLDPGESATLRAYRVTAPVYDDADRPFTLLTVIEDDSTLTVIEDDTTITVTEGD